MAIFHRQLPRNLEAALRDISDKSIDVRRSAVVDLSRYAGCSNDARIGAALSGALKDPDPRVRTHAAYALGDAQVADALPQLLLAIDDDELPVRQAALDAVGLLGDRRAMGRLLRAIDDSRADIRFQAIISLGRVAPEEAMLAVHRLAKDEEAQVRHIAIRVAEELISGDDSRAEQQVQLDDKLRSAAVSWLQDPAPSVRVAAAILLARAGDSSGEALLVEVVDGRIKGLDVDDEAAAIELAGRLHLDAAVPGLIRRAYGIHRFFSESFTFLAKVSLARMGQLRSRSSFLKQLGAWSLDRRNQAVLACGKAAIIEAIPILERMRGDESQADPEAVQEALGLLRPDAPQEG